MKTKKYFILKIILLAVLASAVVAMLVSLSIYKDIEIKQMNDFLSHYSDMDIIKQKNANICILLFSWLVGAIVEIIVSTVMYNTVEKIKLTDFSEINKQAEQIKKLKLEFMKKNNLNNEIDE